MSIFTYIKQLFQRIKDYKKLTGFINEYSELIEKTVKEVDSTEYQYMKDLFTIEESIYRAANNKIAMWYEQQKHELAEKYNKNYFQYQESLVFYIKLITFLIYARSNVKKGILISEQELII